MTTINLTGPYTVGPGQTLTFSHEKAFDLDGNSTSPAILTNYGTISVDNGADYPYSGSLTTEGAGQFWNMAGATYSVTGTAYAWALESTVYSNTSFTFHNAGLVSATATTGAAFAVDLDWFGTLYNDGVVAANGVQANGVDLSLFAVVNNTGLIDAEGTGAAYGIFILQYDDETINNSGTIIGHSTDAANSYSFFISNAGGLVTINNSGTLEGQIFEYGQNGGHILLTNTGLLAGDVNLTDIADYYGQENDVIHNDGAIVGNVDLGWGADTFDGVGALSGTLSGGPGDDLLTGNAGNNTIFGDLAAVSADDGNDTIHGGAGDDFIVGGGGNDLIDGGAGNDTASYANAPGAVTVSLAVTIAQDTHSAGTDTLSGIENLVGTAFDDALTGDAGNNVLTGGAGNDTLDGGGGINTVSYADAASGVTVSLATTAAQDTHGGGTDTLTNIQNVIGSSSADTLTGNGSDNVITGGGGNDTINGGTGTDTAAYSDLHTDYTVAQSAGSPTAVTGTGGAVADGADTLASIEKLQFADGTFVYDSAGNATGTQADTAGTQPWSSITSTYDATGSLTSQAIVNDNGTHWVNSYDPANAQSWQVKIDAYDASNRLVSETVNNDDHTHTLTVNDVNNQYAWTTATIQYDANWNVVSMSGTNDDSSHTVSAVSVETALDDITWFTTPYDPSFGGPEQGIDVGGGSENDVLYGHAGDDVLEGGGGNDVLFGGAGNDALSGGTGQNIFVFNWGDPGNDTITDFHAGQDAIVIANSGFFGVDSHTFASAMQFVGADLVISIPGEIHLTIQNILPGAIPFDQILFQ